MFQLKIYSEVPKCISMRISLNRETQQILFSSGLVCLLAILFLSTSFDANSFKGSANAGIVAEKPTRGIASLVESSGEGAMSVDLPLNIDCSKKEMVRIEWRHEFVQLSGKLCADLNIKEEVRLENLQNEFTASVFFHPGSIYQTDIIPLVPGENVFVIKARGKNGSIFEKSFEIVYSK